ncbi:MAG: YhbY family RNA-binding protein [Eubacteriaceae bacterium]|nr:YhbY family RNA-binding protein [Eubacteriaceae bacterium]
MLNSKQRRFLKSKAVSINDTIFVGKDGITDNLIKQLVKELTANELIKGKVLESSLINVKDAADKLAEITNSYVVYTIGKKFVIYKQNKDNERYILP